MRVTESKYRCVPFWSWNGELDEKKLVKQIEWMYTNGVGGFFMHARGGLTTEYLSEKWFSCVKACVKKAQELGMEAYAYDENGWPSGFAGGKLLEDMENHDRYLTFSKGKYDTQALVSYQIKDNRLIRTNEGTDCLNIYMHYSVSTADILNGEVVDKFIALTHEKYWQQNLEGLKGFFTDEPQFYRWGMPYTKVLADYFRTEYDEDILDGLGLLFIECEGYKSFCYKYWKAMQALMLKNFAKKIYLWCDEKGYKLTGHYIEERSIYEQRLCCAGVMPFYEYEHIPGMDWLGRSIGNEIAPKQLGSVAAQLGKPQTLTETFACCGWDVTPKELKKIAEFQYVAGVNLMCQHLFPYEEHGQRKRDYPAHFSSVNPWVKKNFKEFNDYFSILGKLLSESKEIVNVAVLHPMRSAYFGPKWGDGHGMKELDDRFARLVEKLCKDQIGHHYLDETLLAKYGKVEGSHLILGECGYDFLIIPTLYTMDRTTEKLLREYIKNGGKVLLTDGKPEYLEGEAYTYDYLESNVTWEDILLAQPYCVEVDEDVRSTYRIDRDGRKFIYVVNLGCETDVTFSLKDGTSFETYDIVSDTYSASDLKLHFDEGKSYILYISDKKVSEMPCRKCEALYLNKGFSVCRKVDNYLTLDFVRYSFDGITYSESLHHMGVFNELLKRRYEGTLYLKYEFYVEVVPDTCKLLVEKMKRGQISVNGMEVDKISDFEYGENVNVYDIAKYIKQGKDEIILCIHYYQREEVYYALFGENVTESLRNCLAYDTDIEAIYLKGDFGVFGNFKQGKTKNTIIGKDFRIGKQKINISSLIEDGFPFFAGDIELKQTINITDTAKELVLTERFEFAEITINGRDVGKMMFSKRLDISKYLHRGENELKITLTVGLRNLLGPFHTQEEETVFVGPYTFERMGQWQDGTCKDMKEDYAFIKTIV